MVEILTFSNGSRIIAGHYQAEKDIEHYLGLAYDVIGIEEATTLSNRKHQDISTCCRTDKPNWRPRIYSTTNPGGIGHAWYRTKFVLPFLEKCETDTRFVPARVADNRFNNPEYTKVLEGLTGWQKRAWLYGDWDIAAGQFFTTFRREFHVVDSFNDYHRYFQDKFDSRRIADRIDTLLVVETIDEHAKRFIESRDMFFLATVDRDGNPQCSYKGGEPGFVRVLDDRTLAFPVYDGNGMFLSLGNVRATANVGMLFIDFEQPNRLRVNGVASVDEHDPLLAEMPSAILVVRVHTTHVFPNCSRYIHTMTLVERSKFVPRPDVEAPVPDWKRMAWAKEYLPAADPARATETL